MGIVALTNRYFHRFHNVVSIYKDYFGGYEQEIFMQSNYTNLDSLAMKMADHFAVIDFTAKASRKFYQDRHYNESYADLYSAMSLYRVLLTNFDVLSADPGQEAEPEPLMISFFKAGSHSDLTVFLAACLMQFDFLVHIRENLQGRLMVEVRIDAESYYHLESLLNKLGVDMPSIVWYIKEFAIYDIADASVTVPLYLPVTSQWQEKHFKFNDNEDTIVEFVSVD